MRVLLQRKILQLLTKNQKNINIKTHLSWTKHHQVSLHSL